MDKSKKPHFIQSKKNKQINFALFNFFTFEQTEQEKNIDFKFNIRYSVNHIIFYKSKKNEMIGFNLMYDSAPHQLRKI